MSLVATAKGIIDIETKKIAEEIYWEVRRECPKQSGRTARSFRMEKTENGYQIISDKLSAYYIENGNGGSGGTIYPRKAKALKITNGINRTLGYAAHVSAYEGRHFLRDIADRHR